MSGRALSRRVGMDLWDAVRAEPGRVALSFLAVGIGICALTMLLAVLEGLQEKARRMAGELGAGVVAVLPARSVRADAAAPLRPEHARRLETQWPGGRVAALRRYEVDAGPHRITVLATDERLLPLRGWRVEEGRPLDRRDVDLGERHVVISRALAGTLNTRVGGVVLLQQIPWRVVGIAAIGGGGVEQEGGDARLLAGEQTVLAPMTAPVSWNEESREAAHRLDALFLQADGPEDVERLLALARRVLNDVEPDALSWVTAEVLLRGVRRLQAAVRLAGGSVVFLCLALGGATLMSLMVANVRDRIVEIGLRRALGATPGDIARLFVLEACLVTGAAAAAGTLGAALLVHVVQRRFEALARLDPATWLAPMAVAMLLGVCFSWWPARMAAGISPSEALRNE